MDFIVEILGFPQLNQWIACQFNGFPDQIHVFLYETNDMPCEIHRFPDQNRWSDQPNQ